MDEIKIKLALSQKIGLAICSICSIIFFWYPILFLFESIRNDEEDRSIVGFFCFTSLLQIFLFIFSIKVLKGYIRFLKANQVKRLYSSVIPEVLISLPTLAGGIFIIVLLLIWIISLLYFGLTDLLRS